MHSFPPHASHFNFKPGIIQLLPTFHDFESENPYLHLREFEEVCNTCTDQNCSMNIIRLKFFPFSLKDKAKTWPQNLRSESIRTWDEMQAQCWDRFKELLNICPHHGFKTWRLVFYFYEGLTSQGRQVIEMMCNGEFRDKSLEDALDYLDYSRECTTLGYS